jgi:peptidoglycan/LPS O-acetylase OafA/YrhL
MLSWRIYLWLFSGLLLASAAGRFFLYMKKPGMISRIDLVEAVAGVMAIPALLGFAYQRPCGAEFLWRGLCLLLVGLFVGQMFSEKTKKLFAKGRKLAITVMAVQIALGAPAMWALIEYAFLDRAVWKG